MKVKAASKKLGQFFAIARPFILTIGLFVISLPLLLEVGKLIDLSSQKVVLTADQLNVQSQNVQSLAKVVSVPKIPVITDKGLKPPEFGSVAVLAQDFETGQVLFSKNIHSRLSPASTTKLMTAL